MFYICKIIFSTVNMLFVCLFEFLGGYVPLTPTFTTSNITTMIQHNTMPLSKTQSCLNYKINIFLYLKESTKPRVIRHLTILIQVLYTFAWNVILVSGLNKKTHSNTINVSKLIEFSNRFFILFINLCLIIKA